MWKKIHMISGKASVRQAVHPNPADEANRLVQSFAARSSTAQHTQAVQDAQQRLFPARIAATSRSCLQAAPTDAPFTIKELRDTFKTRKDTAAGADKITYSMIKKAGPKTHEELLHLINISFATGRLPPAWKQAQVFLNFQQDPPHPTYTTPAPWEAPPLHFSARKLAKPKANLSPAELASEARASVRSAPTHAADVYFTDGSVDTTTGTAAAVVHHDEFAALYRLPDGSSTLQTELLAILRALQLAVPRNTNVTIHTDSLGAIQALQTVSPIDNVNLITFVLATAKNINDSGRHVHLNWVPSHTGIPGNEAADLAAKEALSLPQVTTPIPSSISQLKASVRRFSHEQAITCLRPWIHDPTSSAHWYNTTRTNTTPFPRDFGRKTRNALHRLRIGYKCLAEVKGTLPLTCCHCDAETVAPLNHYVMNCPATSDMLTRDHAATKDVIANTPHDALARLVTRYPPPR
ncbi:hypothetical protein GWK47_052485 [Chionoecetes opilio]|uniref:ribonuclease H n=1 Tax=Chionoecetes opilio TaxID=41210 RepID=A0A8J5CQ23_CHIOP|nr:hypothetical protein GWK47_052485 [Chionoecetes opilio]